MTPVPDKNTSPSFYKSTLALAIYNRNLLGNKVVFVFASWLIEFQYKVQITNLMGEVSMIDVL